MPTVIFDTDFLSSFLKIGRCDLVQTLYQIDQALIPISVHRELAQTELLSSLLTISWINVPSIEPAQLVSSEQLVQIIQDLKEKDFYKFKSEIREMLLK